MMYKKEKYMKTPEEIKKYIEQHSQEFLDFSIEDLSGYLSWKDAKKYFKEEYQRDVDNGTKEYIQDTKTGKDNIIEYMPFAWDKANCCRGLSAARTINHMANWLWLDGYDALAEEIRDYSYYGKPQLVKICELFGIDWKQYDNDCWKNDESEEGKSAETVLSKLNILI